MPERKMGLNIVSKLSPGDICTLTAAIYNLHKSYPEKYETSVETPVPDLWKNNPYIVPKKEHFKTIEVHYPTIHVCNQLPEHFIVGYTRGLSYALKKPIVPHTNKPMIYLSEKEKREASIVSKLDPLGRQLPYMVVNAGIKRDFTAKQWPLHYYQKVIDETCDVVTWVQVGAREHVHHQLFRCINLVGRTTHRDLIKLVYGSIGTLSGITYLHHLAAAFEKPSIVIGGGREPITWVAYPTTHYLHTVGLLPCCKTSACWKSRILPDNEGDAENCCFFPVLATDVPVAKCMTYIKPEQVIEIVRRIATQ